jgi:glycosyltransferase involved in cell wall biosynthesis
LAGWYQRADAGVFASSCENMPNILLEMMAAGLPIACSSRGVMPEVFGDSGPTFDPEDVPSVVAALELLCLDTELRERSATQVHYRARTYTWERCAAATFEFLAATRW